MKNKIQLDSTYCFIMLMLGSICFGHHYAHHQVHRRCIIPQGIPALNLQSAATREPDGLSGNQLYRRELLMMGIMVPETC